MSNEIYGTTIYFVANNYSFPMLVLPLTKTPLLRDFKKMQILTQLPRWKHLAVKEYWFSLL